jgi:membrane fusion protein (multidrug efflux system)
MFLVARLFSRPMDNAMRIAEDLIVGTDRIYTVNEDSTLTLRKVGVISGQNGEVIVRGLSDGLKIVGQPLTNASEGMKIKIAGCN